MLAAWAVGLGTVVGVATLGMRTVEERTPAETERSAPSATASRPLGARSIRLDQPARRDQLVTTADVVVRGQAEARVARIRVTLESRGGKILATQWIEPRALSPDAAVRFEARFETTTTRPAGALWVIATALRVDGIPIDSVRRRFQLGEVRAVALPTTREVVVRGRVAVTLGDVRIVLQSRAGTEIASASIDPTGHGHADWVPFESRFRLAGDGEGEQPAFIVAVDGDGRPIDDVRHPFSVGRYLFIPASSGPAMEPATRSRRIGEDGLMGGIPFGTNVLSGS